MNEPTTTETKPWYESTTLRGVAVTAVAAISASVFGLTMDADAQNLLLNILTLLGGLVGAGVAVYGRFKASKTIK